MSSSEETKANDDIMSSISGIRPGLSFSSEHIVHIADGVQEWDLDSVDWEELKDGEWTVESAHGVSDWGTIVMAEGENYDNQFPHSFRRRF